MTGAFWIKFETVRLSKNRPAILKLLKNEESAILEIESALSLYFAVAPIRNQPSETREDVRAELVLLAGALSTVGRILNSRGRARSLLVEACADMQDGAHARVMQLEGALFDGDYDVLAKAARAAIDELEVTAVPTRSFDKMARVRLVQSMAAAGAKVGITACRKNRDINSSRGDFDALVQAVYESAGIEKGDGETYKADGDIKAAGF